MNELARAEMQARLDALQSERETLRGRMRAVHENWQTLVRDFGGVQDRIDALREELGLGGEEGPLVIPPELEAVA